MNDIIIDNNVDDSNKLIENSKTLKEKSLDIVQQIIEENDASKIKNLTQLFNAAHIKKQVLRSITYDNILDHITSQMEERISKRGDQFSNKDLLDYANSVTSSLEKAQKQILGVDETPLIQFNQQNNNIIAETLSDESKQKVELAIKSILKRIEESNSISINDSKDDEMQKETSVYDIENLNEEEIIENG